VHTARCAGPSIGKSFNYRVALCRYLVSQIGWRRLSKRRFSKPQHGRSPPAQVFFQTVKKHVTAWFIDVEQPNGQAIY
tara:strand:- start:359 stop:592 length:234 start_codon:yes stop_codon:yes gene_type:complete